MSDRANTLLQLIDRFNFQTGVEVGVFRGDTLFKLLDARPHLYMVGVDAWVPILGKPQDKTTGEASYEGHDMEAYFREVTAKALKYPKRCGIIRAPSLETAREWPPHAFDFCFIDADHRTGAVIADVNAWAPKVRPGGIVAGHDENWPSVRRALIKLFPKGYYKAPGNVWFIQRDL